MKNLIRKILNEELNQQKKNFIKFFWNSQKNDSVLPKINWRKLNKLKLYPKLDSEIETEIIDLWGEYLGLNEEERFEKVRETFVDKIFNQTFFTKHGIDLGNDEFTFKIFDIYRVKTSRGIDVMIRQDLIDFTIETSNGVVDNHEDWPDEDYWGWSDFYRGKLEDIMFDYLQDYGIIFTDVYVEWG